MPRMATSIVRCRQSWRKKSRQLRSSWILEHSTPLRFHPLVSVLSPCLARVECITINKASHSVYQDNSADTQSAGSGLLNGAKAVERLTEINPRLAVSLTPYTIMPEGAGVRLPQALAYLDKALLQCVVRDLALGRQPTQERKYGRLSE